MMEIRIDDVTSVQTIQLIQLHLSQMQTNSPAGLVFALGVEALRGSDVTVWTAWEEDSICGVGALRQLDSVSGEVKAMRTHSKWLRKGVGSAILKEIVQEARRRKLLHLSLETGGGEAFRPAIELYRKSGFIAGAPFGHYRRTEFNQFFHLAL